MPEQMAHLVLHHPLADPAHPQNSGEDDLAATQARMADRHVNVLLVSTPEGKLLGAVRGPR